IQSLMKIDEIRAKDELLFMKNEIYRYEDKIRVKDEMLLFMENKKHRCDEKLDVSDEMLLKYKNVIHQCYKELNNMKDL
ncbi:27197_t:CDS:2, partial [Gigaspora margarita]